MTALTPTPYDPENWGERVDIKTIQRTPVPVQGPETWRPLPHDSYVQMIEQSLLDHGFEISEPVHYRGVSRDNKKIKDLPKYGRFLSMYGISHPDLTPIDGLVWEAAFQNSYDMTSSAKAIMGRRVMVCTNGCFFASGEETTQFRRKHTKGIDRDREGHFESLFGLLNKSIGGLLRQAEGEERRILRWQNTGCNDDDARYVAVEAAKQKVIGWAAVGRVLEHWATPEHPEFKDRNVWSLENAFTSNDRGSNLMTQQKRMLRLDGIINKRFGFAAPVPDSVDEDFSFGESPITSSHMQESSDQPAALDPRDF